MIFSKRWAGHRAFTTLSVQVITGWSSQAPVTVGRPVFEGSSDSPQNSLNSGGHSTSSPALAAAESVLVSERVARSGRRLVASMVAGTPEVFSRGPELR